MPAEILKRPPNCFDLFTSTEQQELYSIINKYDEIAERAFGYWVRHIRWKFNIGSIARPLIHGHESGWPSTLEETNNRRTIWIDRGVFQIGSRNRVTQDQWENAQKSLKKGIKSPLYYDYFFDGEEILCNGYHGRALIDFCIAVKSVLRELLESKMPDALHPELKDYLSGVSISTLKGKKFQKALFDNSTLTYFERENIFKHLSEMFENRNKLMHHGELNECIKQELWKYRHTSKNFIDSAHNILK